MDLSTVNSAIKQHQPKFQKVREELAKVIIGQTSMVEHLILAILSDGHVLLEGLPGLAKTLSVTTLAKIIQCDYKRIQFTPDLLPADLIGTSVYNPKEGLFSIKKGPIFTNILLADEINRAPAKVQSALLEVMQERQITISGQTFAAGNPYLVLATQNPIEQEGTYNLPEAQTDRFMLKIRIDYPTKEEEQEILRRMATLGPKPTVQPIINAEDILEARQVVNDVHIDEKIIAYILDLIFATRNPKKYGVDIEGLLMFGASPRASIALKIMSKAHAFWSERAYVTPHDVEKVIYEVLRHRLRRSYEAEAEGVSPDEIIRRILQKIPKP